MFPNATTKNDNMRGIQGNAANVTNDAKSAFNEAKTDVKANISDVADKAKRSAKTFVNSASEQLSDVSDKMSSQIRENPVRAALIALGAGYILGKLFR